MNLLERTPPDPLGRPDLVDAVDLDPRVHADVDPGVRADPLFQDPFGRPEQDPLARPLTCADATGVFVQASRPRGQGAVPSDPRRPLAAPSPDVPHPRRRAAARRSTHRGQLRCGANPAQGPTSAPSTPGRPARLDGTAVLSRAPQEEYIVLPLILPKVGYRQWVLSFAGPLAGPVVWVTLTAS
jgi:hypothetical protein